MIKTNVQLVSAAVSDKGLSDKRPVNEDSYLEMPERGLFAVADGVGGAQAGDTASQTAMEVLQDAFSHPQPNVDNEELLEMAIQRANESIFEMSHELPQLDMMATTIVTLQIDGNIATIGHVGDSRLYRLDERGNLFRETRDHSMVEEEVRAGRMTAAQAANHPQRNVISRALGAENTVEVDMRTIMFEPGTIFLLCSDGVTRHIEDHELKEILFRNRNSVSDACREFKAICYNRGAEDNLTAVVVRIEGGDDDFFDEETTIPGVRPPAFAPNPLPSLSNGGQRGAESTEARAEEFAALNVVSPDANTAPLDETHLESGASPETQDLLKPASQTFGVTDPPPSPSEATLQSKIENERIRAKIDAAEPSFGNYSEPAKSGSLIPTIFGGLLLLLVGAALGAGGFYAFNMLNPPQVAAPPTNNQILLPNTNNNFSQQEINEFTNFERVRRTVDSRPNAETKAQPETAADYYLRGRALLQTGKTDDARAALLKAEQLLGDDRSVNQDMLRVDIAFAKAALGAVTGTASDRKMLGDLVGQKNGTAESNANSLPDIR